jgi:hypothetical protein
MRDTTNDRNVLKAKAEQSDAQEELRVDRPSSPAAWSG